MISQRSVVVAVGLSAKSASRLPLACCTGLRDSGTLCAYVCVFVLHYGCGATPVGPRQPWSADTFLRWKATTNWWLVTSMKRTLLFCLRHSTTEQRHSELLIIWSVTLWFCISSIIESRGLTVVLRIGLRTVEPRFLFCTPSRFRQVSYTIWDATLPQFTVIQRACGYYYRSCYWSMAPRIPLNMSLMQCSRVCQPNRMSWIWIAA